MLSVVFAKQTWTLGSFKVKVAHLQCWTHIRDVSVQEGD
jgi:hypothetical protein